MAYLLSAAWLIRGRRRILPRFPAFRTHIIDAAVSTEVLRLSCVLWRFWESLNRLRYFIPQVIKWHFSEHFSYFAQITCHLLLSLYRFFFFFFLNDNKHVFCSQAIGHTDARLFWDRPGCSWRGSLMDLKSAGSLAGLVWPHLECVFSDSCSSSIEQTGPALSLWSRLDPREWEKVPKDSWGPGSFLLHFLG